MSEVATGSAGLLAEIALAIDCEAEALTPEANPFDYGMDSVRLIALVEGWRARGIEVEAAELAARYSVAEWLSALGAEVPGA